MSLGQLVGKLLGTKKTAPETSAAAGRQPHLRSPAAAPAPARRDPGVLVHREEMIDGRTRLCGYRFRTVAWDGAAPPAPLAKLNALKADNLADFAWRRPAIVPIRVDEWQAQDFRQFVSPNTFFEVETPAAGTDNGDWLAGVREIKASGARVALDSALLSSQPAEALAVADAVTVNLADYSLEGFARLVGKLRGHNGNPTILADGIHSWPEYRMCQGIGAHYCLGSFATTPDQEDGAEALPESRLVLIEMLNLLRRDADPSELAGLAKRDPAIAFKVLQMANSPLQGLPAPVASIQRALHMLGRESLYRWVAVAMFRSGSGRGKDEALLEIALGRARFLELLALGQLSKTESDELFVLGLMSVMDSLLGAPMDKVLETMALPGSVTEALLHGQGPYAPYLALAQERNADRARELATALPLDAETITKSQGAARAWAEQAMAQS